MTTRDTNGRRVVPVWLAVAVACVGGIATLVAILGVETPASVGLKLDNHERRITAAEEADKRMASSVDVQALCGRLDVYNERMNGVMDRQNETNARLVEHNRRLDTLLDQQQELNRRLNRAQFGD